jgi:serine/threonine protein kinase
MKEIRVLGKVAFRRVTLIEDPSNGDLVALKSFNESGSTDREASSTFFQEVEALIRLADRCIIQIVGYCLATSMSPPQIGMKFTVNSSLRDALDKMAGTSRPRFMDETGIARVLSGRNSFIRRASCTKHQAGKHSH